MLKKLSNFVVNRRVAILALILVTAIAGVVCSGFVTINDDMTKYLPDDSNMKEGMDIMAEAFPEMETSNSIRVMFDDLTDADKSVILEKLKVIENVDSVDHDPVSEDYNKDNHTLFVINMSCDYGSAEEAAIESALKSEFSDYKVVWQNNDTSTPTIPTIVIVVVMIIIFAILFTMCGSWFEPFLFLITIGIAIVINSGTNIFLGEISSVTNAIAALLQMVLSMDYSIIMMNRYRQERQLEPDKIKAMKTAWKNAFASVASSSLTTVVGLLMLVFMSFRIGADLGIVLAKGVFISMICVITVLPGLILICDKLLSKTEKKEPHIPMKWVARFSYKARFVLAGVFVVLFVGFYILQSFTGIAYTLVKDDAVANVFPKNNMLVMVYDNDDEETLTGLIEKLENDKNVTSVMGYGTVLGKPHTADKLTEVIGEMSSDVTLNSAMVGMLYYHYYNDGNIGTMTVEDFLSFISETVVNDDTFDGYIDEDMMANIDRIGMFADKAELQKERTPAELAAMLSIDESTVQTVFVLHNAQDVSDKTMSLAQFTGFLTGNLLNNPTFADSFDAQSAAQLAQMNSLIQLAASGQSLTPARMAQALGMEEAQVGGLYYLYFSTNVEFRQEIATAKMTLPAFLTLLKANTDEEQQAQLVQMEQLIGVSVSGAELTAAELSAITGMPEQQIGMLFMMQSVDKMTLPAFLNVATAMAPANTQLHQLNQIVGLAVSGAELDATTLAGVFEIQPMQVMQLMGMNLATQKSIPFATFTAFLVNDVMSNPAYASSFTEEQMTQIAALNQLAGLAASGTPLNTQALAIAFGMEESMVNTVFRLYYGGNIADKTLSLESTVDFILADSVVKGYTDTEMLGQLQMMQGIVKAAVNETQLTAAQMGELFSGLTDSFDSESLEIMYLFAQSMKNSDTAWTMSLETLFNHLVDKVIDDARFAPFIDEDMKASLLENKTTLEDGKKQLVGDEYSRLVITTTYSDESEATTAFLNGIEDYAKDNMSGKVYLIGESAMTHEMQKIFDTELTFITLLTALAIFLIVMLTFKSLPIPLILVLLVQCGVYITVTATGILSGEIYYLALLIVECILMGATIDYGILFTNYYQENRKTLNVKDALAKAYEGSIHTIMTSGLILVIVTAIVGGMFEDATVASIVRTISIGSFCAIMLILFVLPGVLATCDKLIIKKKNRVENSVTKAE